MAVNGLQSALKVLGNHQAERDNKRMEKAVNTISVWGGVMGNLGNDLASTSDLEKILGQWLQLSPVGAPSRRP